MKSERITFLATPEFKANLTQLAVRVNTSVGEVIRGRFERAQTRPPDASEESELRALVADLRVATAQAQISLSEGLAEAEQTLRELRKSSQRKAAA